MNTTKYEIELPTLPEGFEVVGNGKYKHGDLRLCQQPNGDGQWYWGCGGEGINYSIIARRKRALADWANEQPLFKALVEIPWNDQSPVFLDPGSRPVMGWWLYHGELNEGSAPLAHLGGPPNGLTGKLTLENGKWKDVQ